MDEYNPNRKIYHEHKQNRFEGQIQSFQFGKDIQFKEVFISKTVN